MYVLSDFMLQRYGFSSKQPNKTYKNQEKQKLCYEQRLMIFLLNTDDSD